MKRRNILLGSAALVTAQTLGKFNVARAAANSTPSV